MFKYDRRESPGTLEQRYEDQAQIQRALVSDLRNLRNLLTRLRQAFRLVLADEGFTTLLRAEGIDRAPVLLDNGSGPMTGDSRRNELEGGASAAYELLASKKLSPTARHELSRMVPTRQEEAARLMIASGCFISPYIRALVGASDKALLATGKGRPRKLLLTESRRRATNREISELAAQLKDLSDLSGIDLLRLLVTIRYAERLVSNPRVSRYLSKRWPQAQAELGDAIKSYSEGPIL
ncbi:MAG TPA: plasmid partitioning protein RepB C-terminal domain-containing protein [Bryobacteraceae bacterium]|jgi:hypothetical protein|nr:plasmid partitioning protein RepB C-terminal domain-containing protein [Bryobacteraceae bacterium]